MTGSWTQGLLRSRWAMWLVFGVYFIVYLTAQSLSNVAGIVVVVIGALTMLGLLFRARRSPVRGSISTVCEDCGSQLPVAMGFPRPLCQECGKRQSWARGSAGR